MSEWKKVEMGTAWNYVEEGLNAEIIGLYVGKEEEVGENKSNLYSLEQPNGEVLTVWGNTVLDARLKNIKTGEEVKIIYLGKAKSERTNREYHNFDVYHREVEHEFLSA